MTRSALKPDVSIAGSGTPAVFHGAPRNRRIVDNRVALARQTLGVLEPGCEIFALTAGQFSLIDAVEYVLSVSGPADVDIATWTAADSDLTRAHAFLLSKSVTSLRMLIDPSFRARKPKFCETLTRLFGDDALRTVPLHGKFVAIRGQRSFAIRSSMNLNPNRRIENIEISEDPALVQFLAGFVDGVFETPAEANFSTQSMARFGQPTTASRLVF